MLFKILGIERAYSKLSEDLAHPRQVFVTQSRVLVGKVEEIFFEYLESLSAGSSGHKNIFQRIRNRDADDDFLIDEDDNEEWRCDLPQRYSELEDKHFPLFITFDAVSFTDREVSLSLLSNKKNSSAKCLKLISATRKGMTMHFLWH